MACNFITDIAENGTKFKLIFECDDKDAFMYMVEAARCCIDGGPQKQIEETARIVSKCITSWLNNETTKSSPDYIAEALYNAGYRKASDVASEIIDAVFEILDAEYRQYDTETLSDVLNKMYMSSRNTVIKITAELVKFKEKYTEEWE